LARGVFRTAAAALLALALTVGALDWLARRFDRQLRHSGEVMRVARQAYELALDRDAGVRGYLLTRDPTSLAPELFAREPLAIALDSLSVLTAKDPAQAERTGTIRAAVDRWANVFALPALRHPDAALGRHGDKAELVGKTLFDAVRWSFTKLIDAEDVVYNAQRRRQESTRAFANVAIVLELAVLLAVLVRVRRRIVAQANALADQQARVRAVIEHAPDVILLVDGDGTVRYHSPSAEELMGRENLLVGFLIQMAFVGLPEEFFYRVFVQTRLSQVLKTRWGGILVTSLLFGLTHIPNVMSWYPEMTLSEAFCSAFFIQGFIGLIYGVLWDRTHNLIPGVIVHSGLNALNNVGSAVTLIFQ